MATERGHWYTADGKLVEDADLRMAKKQLLYPSVTTLTKQLAESPGLRNWRERQMVISGATNPWRPEETDAEFSARVIEEAYHEGAEAAERGKGIHSAIQRRLQDRAPDPDNKWKVPDDLAEWMDTHLARAPDCDSELSLTSTKLGFAGTTDYWGPYLGDAAVADSLIMDKFTPSVVVDFKTQGVKHYTTKYKRTLRSGIEKEYTRVVKSPSWYDSWPIQLAGYGAILMDKVVDPIKHVIAPEKFVSW